MGGQAAFIRSVTVIRVMAGLTNQEGASGWGERLSLNVSKGGACMSPQCSSVKAVLQNQDLKGVKRTCSRILEEEGGDCGMKY